MSFKEYVFDIPEKQELSYKIPTEVTIFHQICAYPNPKSQLHCVRTLHVGGNNEIIHQHEKCYQKKALQKFIQSSRGNDYKMYSTYDLNSIPLPTCGELLVAKSEMLSHDYGYSGYAPY